jgi:hypothetical protein
MNFVEDTRAETPLPLSEFYFRCIVIGALFDAALGFVAVAALFWFQ